MQLSKPFTWMTLSDIGVWARELVSTITRSWNIEHRPSGRHRFPWESIVFTDATFTSDSGSWTVDAADITTHEYRVIDDTLELAWRVIGTDVEGTPTELRIGLPSGFVAASDRVGTHWYSNAGTTGTGFAGILSGQAFVRLYTFSGAAWTATTSDNTSTGGYLAIKVRTNEL